jgi:hypothetical protein
MIPFVDPRSNPEPPPQVSRESAAHGEELLEFIRLCSSGCLYGAERWIQEGQPIQALAYKRPKKPTLVSPLRAAIRDRNADIVLLLVCNGYRLDLEESDRGGVLDEALTNRAFEIMELLLKWGADPTKINSQNVLDTYRTDLIERFWKDGVDYTADLDFPGYLAHTVNKPLYGWLRQNRSDQRLQDALDVALLEAVIEDKERAVCLLLWAGADPHRQAPMLRDLGEPDAWGPESTRSSAEAGISFGRQKLLKHLRIDKMPDLNTQATNAHDCSTLKMLVALCPPADWSGVIISFLREFRQFHSPFFTSSTWDARDALRFIESSGGRLTAVPSDEMKFLRSILLGAREDDFTWALKWLKKEKNCDPAVYHELTRTQAMRQKMTALTDGSRYLSPSVKMSHASQRRRRAAERNRDQVPR